jgi:shikimate dehydrogenase
VATRQLLSRTARRAAVLGRPVSHSQSPALHRAAYAALGLTDWQYEALDVGVDELPAVLAGMDREWAGLSVTMPLKQAVIPLLDDVTPLAAAVGAVNTVVVEPSGPCGSGDTASGVTLRGDRASGVTLRGDGASGVTLRGDGASGVTLRGDNTDVAGLVAAAREAGVGRVERACVLGAGATGASALAALAELGCRTPTVQLRSPGRGAELVAAARRLGVQPVLVEWGHQPSLLGSDLVISTVPAGATDTLAALVPGSVGGRRGTLLDVVYDPWPTPLVAAWSAAGGAVVDGLAMLLHQAAAQVALFTGRTAPVAAMRAAVAARRA